MSVWRDLGLNCVGSTWFNGYVVLASQLEPRSALHTSSGSTPRHWPHHSFTHPNPNFSLSLTFYEFSVTVAATWRRCQLVSIIIVGSLSLTSLRSPTPHSHILTLTSLSQTLCKSYVAAAIDPPYAIIAGSSLLSFSLELTPSGPHPSFTHTTTSSELARKT